MKDIKIAKEKKIVKFPENVNPTIKEFLRGVLEIDPEKRVSGYDVFVNFLWSQGINIVKIKTDPTSFNIEHSNDFQSKREECYSIFEKEFIPPSGGNQKLKLDYLESIFYFNIDSENPLCNNNKNNQAEKNGRKNKQMIFETPKDRKNRKNQLFVIEEQELDITVPDEDRRIEAVPVVSYESFLNSAITNLGRIDMPPVNDLGEGNLLNIRFRKQ